MHRSLRLVCGSDCSESVRLASESYWGLMRASSHRVSVRFPPTSRSNGRDMERNVCGCGRPKPEWLVSWLASRVHVNRYDTLEAECNPFIATGISALLSDYIIRIHQGGTSRVSLSTACKGRPSLARWANKSAVAGGHSRSDLLFLFTRGTFRLLTSLQQCTLSSAYRAGDFQRCSAVRRSFEATGPVEIGRGHRPARMTANESSGTV